MGSLRSPTATRERPVRGAGQSASGCSNETPCPWVATLANGAVGKNIEVFYWSNRNREVDFVLRRGDKLTAIEVKSGQRKDTLPGMASFCNEFPVSRKLLVGADGIPLDEFLLTPVETWVE